MVIPVNVPVIGKEEISAVINILKQGDLTSAANKGGKNVQEFEKMAAKYVNSKFAVAVNSGTAALQAALHALDVKRGDEVLLPSFTFVATANAVVSTGAKPVFVDISTENFTMDPKDLEKKITKKSKVIIPVHLYGNVAYVDEISEVAKKHNLRILEDAAQSLGSTYRKRHTGTFFDVGCYSMYPAKVMTSGEGGFIVTNNKKSYERLLMIRNHGMLHGYDTRVFGLNLRMPEINAAIAKEQIKKLPKFLSKRKKNAEFLTELLAKTDLQIPNQRKHEKVNWYLYTIASSARKKIQEKLNAKGFGAAAYYPIPVHKTPFYKSKMRLKSTDWAASCVLSIPVHPQVTAKNLEDMAKIIRDTLK